MSIIKKEVTINDMRELADDLRMLTSQISEACNQEGDFPHPWRLDEWLIKYATYYKQIYYK